MKNAVHYAVLFASGLFGAAFVAPARADFAGPGVASHAISPDGRIVVRLRKIDSEVGTLLHEVSFYKHDPVDESFVRRSKFTLKDCRPQMIYVSDSGDLILVSLFDAERIRLYRQDGKLIKAWKETDILTPKEVEACPHTGSTLQWFDEGAFAGDAFYFCGPARFDRGFSLAPWLGEWAEAPPSFRYSAVIEMKNAELKRDPQE